MRIPALTTSFALALAIAACDNNAASNDMSTEITVEDDAAMNAALGVDALTDDPANAAMQPDAASNAANSQ